jgi:hypothetical protein
MVVKGEGGGRALGEKVPNALFLCYRIEVTHLWRTADVGDLIGEILRLGELGPEKAGVGGSIPSLATIFSSIYSHHKSRFGSIWFQNLIRAHRDSSQTHTQ